MKRCSLPAKASTKPTPGSSAGSVPSPTAPMTSPVAAIPTYPCCGTDRRSAIELIEDALNLRVPTVYDHDPDTDRDVINGSATEAARDKQEKLKERRERDHS